MEGLYETGGASYELKMPPEGIVAGLFEAGGTSEELHTSPEWYAAAQWWCVRVNLK